VSSRQGRERLEERSISRRGAGRMRRSGEARRWKSHKGGHPNADDDGEEKGDVGCVEGTNQERVFRANVAFEYSL